MAHRKEIPIALPWFGEEEVQAVRETILSGWVTQGPRVAAFETAFARYTGARHACAVSSCTAALHVALSAVGVGPGDVVITVSHSFIATANAIRHCQAEPVFVDIESATLNMSPDALARCLAEDFVRRDDGLWFRDIERLAVGESPLCGRVTPLGRLAAILVVHQVGMPADLARIMKIAGACRVPVVEDAACATGSEWRSDRDATWEKIGRPRGDIACFSFHPRKVITTGDGGMLTTNNPDHDRRFRLMRQHGMSVSDLERHDSQDVVFEDYVATGYNYRMTDVQAALGIEQLKRLPEIVARRRRLASRYGEQLAGVDGVVAPAEPEFARANWQSYVIGLHPRFDQMKVMQELRNKGISARRGVMCAHLEKPYASPWRKGSLPNSEHAQRHGVMLPLYPLMENAELDQVVSALKAIRK